MISVLNDYVSDYLPNRQEDFDLDNNWKI
jgi:hypothetical protein